jgi:hypothetical protein
MLNSWRQLILVVLISHSGVAHFAHTDSIQAGASQCVYVTDLGAGIVKRAFMSGTCLAVPSWKEISHFTLKFAEVCRISLVRTHPISSIEDRPIS